MGKKERKLVANNKKARHDYFLEEIIEAGIALTGTEIKSVRAGKVSIKESYAKVDGGELIIYGMHISPYREGNRYNVDPLRPRRLLVHKREIRKMIGATTQQGMTIVPVQMYINEEGRAKVEIALARGKKQYDKRESIAQRDAKRAMERAVRKRG